MIQVPLSFSAAEVLLNWRRCFWAQPGVSHVVRHRPGPVGGGEGAEQRNKPGPVSLMSQSSSEAKSGVASQDRSFPSGK